MQSSCVLEAFFVQCEYIEVKDMNFVAMDFETANAKRASACSIALAIVRDNQVAHEFYSLINPEMEFSWRNINVHGIHEKDVVDAPTFPEVWDHIAPLFTANKLVIAHNAAFDNSVLKRTLERYDVNPPTISHWTHCERPSDFIRRWKIISSIHFARSSTLNWSIIIMP